MIERRLLSKVNKLLAHFPAVAILGPRQVGKTTLATSVAQTHPSVYLDLENPEDVAKLANPRSFLAGHLDKLVELDECSGCLSCFRLCGGSLMRLGAKASPRGVISFLAQPPMSS